MVYNKDRIILNWVYFNKGRKPENRRLLKKIKPPLLKTTWLFYNRRKNNDNYFTSG